MAASLLYAHQGTERFSGNGSIHAASRFQADDLGTSLSKFCNHPLMRKKQGELAQTFLQGVLGARQATA
jgi:hypothetical protein